MVYSIYAATWTLKTLSKFFFYSITLHIFYHAHMPGNQRFLNQKHSTIPVDKLKRELPSHRGSSVQPNTELSTDKSYEEEKPFECK